MPDTKKLIGAAAFAFALAGGGVAGALLGAPSVSGAQEAEEEAPADDTAERGRPGCFARGVHLETAATALGMTAAELREALADGSTIADVAAAQGVDLQTVIDALVADASARIDERVAAGDITAEQGEARKAELVERVTAFVNGEGPLGPPRGRGPGHRRFGDEHPADDTADDTADVPADETTGS